MQFHMIILVTLAVFTAASPIPAPAAGPSEELMDPLHYCHRIHQDQETQDPLSTPQDPLPTPQEAYAQTAKLDVMFYCFMEHIGMCNIWMLLELHH
ncbi:hypothetical protein K435DRAFT_879119 [Dendrothele bispora CBS 962.96]|uniref:Uncharacterized protein n=1 Tax=Dendrothele bispora (strain CBS 962.96) TaxID=1314807 RepID=A0A4S8KLT0_DENBC|nr:hypothetical protein K435DRAFT_879119 [Dendrothele bispora CBS 962.96]